MAALTLTFLGGFDAHASAAPISRMRVEKVRALLAYLTVEAARSHQRAHLAGLLWPEQGDDLALRNLSQTLIRLREAIGEPLADPAFLRITRQTIQWNVASDYWLDVAAFARLAHSAETADLEQAAALYRSEFL